MATLINHQIKNKLFPDERLKRLEDYTKIHQQATIEEPAAALNVAKVTVRRDLAHLKKKSSIKRTNGGAIYASLTGKEYSFNEKALHTVNECRNVIIVKGNQDG